MHRKNRSDWKLGLMLAAVMTMEVNAAVVRVVLDVKSGKTGTFLAEYPVSRAELAAGGDRIVGVEISGDTLLMTPLQEGRATVYVFDPAEMERDRLEVFVGRSEESGPLDAAVRSLLVDSEGRPIPGITVASVTGSDKVRIMGRITNKYEFDRVAQVRAVFGEGAVDLTEFDPDFCSSVEAAVRKLMANGNVEVSFVGRELFLQGMVFSESEKVFLEAAARSVYPAVRSFLTVKPWKSADMPQDVVLEKPLLLLECQLVEITLDTMREMGVDWGGVQTLNLQAGWSAVAGGSDPVSSVSLGTAKLFQLLLPHVQSGDARVLYTQNLVCEDGGNSRFFAGGSFHIVAKGADDDDVEVKEVEYGIGMNLEPRLDKHGNLETKVAIEFSSLGPVIGQYPSMLKRYVRTSVNVKQGQTLSLGALIGHTATEDVSKIPGLGDIPVLGELFKSERYRTKKSELVILITPRRIMPGGPEEVALREGMRDKVESSGGSRDGRNKEK